MEFHLDTKKEGKNRCNTLSTYLGSQKDNSKTKVEVLRTDCENLPK